MLRRQLQWLLLPKQHARISSINGARTSLLCENHAQCVSINVGRRRRCYKTLVTFQNNDYLNQHHSKHEEAKSLFSSITTTIEISKSVSAANDLNNAIQYLYLEKFPLGSFDGQIVRNITTAIARFIEDENKDNKGNNNNENIESFQGRLSLAFDLLQRIAQEAKHERNNERNNTQPDGWNCIFGHELLIPSNLLHDVVNVWRLHWKGKKAAVTTIPMTTSTTKTNADLLSPRTVFEKVKECEANLPAFHRNLVPFTMIIYAAAATQDVELADEILNYLLESRDNGVHYFADVVAFNGVIEAWAQSGHPDAPLRADAVLKKAIEYCNAGWVEATPDVHLYTSVMTVWSNSSHHHENAPHRIEELLLEMEGRGLYPNSVSYSSVLTAWSRSTENQAPGRAEAILNHLIKLYEEGVINAKPNSHCYSAVISAYAKRGDVQQAERILKEQISRFQSTNDPDFLPNRFCFTSVINAWSKSGRANAPLMAEAILQRMQDLAESWGEPSLVPEVVSFTAVLNAWARSKDRNAPNRCEKILQRMQDLYDQGFADCRPETRSFNTVIDCWAKSSSLGEEAPERAEAILRQMEHLQARGSHFAKPNIISYNTVMNAWSISSHPDSTARTQALFDEILRKYDTGDVDMKPTFRTFGTLITAWGRSRRSDGGARAQAVFDDMLARYRAGDADLKPSIVVCNALIDAWARAAAPKKAEQILRQMNSNSLIGVKPDTISYNSVMSAWARCGMPERVQALMEELLRKHEAGDQLLKPSLRSFTILVKVWGRSQRRDGAERAQSVFDDLMLRYRSGNKDMKPDAVIYGALIEAWTRAGAPDKAEHMLRDMEGSFKPNAALYGSVMHGWYLSGHSNSVDRVEALYDEMIRRYRAGESMLKPNNQVYDVLLSTLIHRGQQGGIPKAQAVFEELQSRYNCGEAELEVLLKKFESKFDSRAKVG